MQKIYTSSRWECKLITEYRSHGCKEACKTANEMINMEDESFRTSIIYIDRRSSVQ